MLSCDELFPQPIKKNIAMSFEVLQVSFRGAITRIMMCAVVALAVMLPMPCRCAASVQPGERDSLTILADRLSRFCSRVP